MTHPASLRQWLTVAIALWVCLSAMPLGAQTTDQTVEFEELGLTLPLYSGARAAGLAGAYATICNDAHSLYYNPAGLARIRRVEVTAGFQFEDRNVTTQFYGSPGQVSNNAGGLDAFTVAYPAFTYRGNLVAAVGVFRWSSSALDVARRGIDTEGLDSRFLLQQTGGIYSYHAGLGVDLSPALSGGVSINVVHGSVDVLRQYDFTATAGNGVSQFVVEDITQNITGFGARAGMQLFALSWLRLGATLSTPTWLKVSGTQQTETTVYNFNAADDFESSSMTRSRNYLVPFRVETGAALNAGPVVAMVEACYSDWREAAIDSRRFRNRQFESVFQPTWDIRAGIEYSATQVPLRVRAGYAYRPYPLKYLQRDHLENDEIEEASVGAQRQQIAGGAGYLFGERVMVDAAYTHTWGDRALDILVDEREFDQFFLTVGYRY